MNITIHGKKPLYFCISLHLHICLFVSIQRWATDYSLAVREGAFQIFSMPTCLANNLYFVFLFWHFMYMYFEIFCICVLRFLYSYFAIFLFVFVGAANILHRNLPVQLTAHCNIAVCIHMYFCISVFMYMYLYILF